MIATAAAVLIHATLVSTAVPAPRVTSTEPARPTQETPALGGHVHEGEIGAKLLYVERRIRCNCGCTLDVHSCQYQMQCGTSPGWSARILKSLERGESTEAIEAGFAADFGPMVLLSPPIEGFNLFGYILPGLALLMGGALVGLVVRGGIGRPGKPVTVTDLSPEERARLEAELRRLDESEGPVW